MMNLDAFRYEEPAVDDDASASRASGGGTTRGERFLEFIDMPTFPCVAAKAALARGAIETHEFGSLLDSTSDAGLLSKVHAFGRTLSASDADDTTLRSFVAVFSDTGTVSENVFEDQIWGLLQRLHHIDAVRGVAWASDISRDPASPEFSLSLGGVPFFIIGLHPNASRIARRFPHPVVVFNSHRQFEALRADGRYQKMQKATRARDTALQGSINPNLADFGSASEARQYSGREVDAAWRCPFHVETA